MNYESRGASSLVVAALPGPDRATPVISALSAVSVQPGQFLRPDRTRRDDFMPRKAPTLFRCSRYSRWWVAGRTSVKTAHATRQPGSLRHKLPLLRLGRRSQVPTVLRPDPTTLVPSRSTSSGPEPVEGFNDLTPIQLSKNPALSPPKGRPKKLLSALIVFYCVLSSGIRPLQLVGDEMTSL